MEEVGGGGVLTPRKLISHTVIEERCKFGRLADLLISPFFVVCLYFFVTSSLALFPYVSMSLRPRAPETTASQTL